MARPLRIEFPGATYHVTGRGNRQAAIFDNDDDRRLFLEVLGHSLDRADASVLAYCLMGNHYHLVVQTRRANLSALMRQVGGIYTQRVNHRHGRSGHVFQGRFKAILVDRDAYLLEVCRYVELNPVRARLIDDPADWRWSSLRAHLGLVDAPTWLDIDNVYGVLLGHSSATPHELRRARRLYAKLLASAPDLSLWTTGLRQQVYLGDEAFVQRMQAMAQPSRLQSRDVPQAQRHAPQALQHYLDNSANRAEAFARAHREGGFTLTAIGGEVGLSTARVSQIVAGWERAALAGVP